LGANYADGLSLSGAIGVALARNTLNDHVESRLRGISTGDQTLNSLTVSAGKPPAATGKPSIKATSAAVSLAVAWGQKGSLSLAGGGADAFNTVLGDVLAGVDDSELRTAADLSIATTHDQRLTAGVGAGVGSGSFAPSGGSLAVGAVKTQNLIGVDSMNGADLLAKIGSSVTNSRLSSGGDLSLTSSSTAAYDALAVPVSVALTTGQIGVAFSGAFNNSRIANAINSSTSGSTLVAGRDLIITASGDSQVTGAKTDGGALSATFNTSGVSLAVGAAQNNNVIDNTITVTISDGTSGGSSSAGRSALRSARSHASDWVSVLAPASSV
jgi:hypothetical protein